MKKHTLVIWLNKKPDNFIDIPRYKNLYAINIKGQIYSYPKYRWKGKMLKTYKSRQGYIKTSLVNVDGNNHLESIHRLLMETFKPIKDSELFQVNHLNAIKDDNRIENLEWCTPKENVNHARRLGLYPPVSIEQTIRFKNLGKKYGAKNGLAVCRPIVQLSKRGKFIAEFSSTSEAARTLGLNLKAINNVLRGIENRSGGYGWIYAEKTKELWKKEAENE